MRELAVGATGRSSRFRRSEEATAGALRAQAAEQFRHELARLGLRAAPLGGLMGLVALMKGMALNGAWASDLISICFI